jgi:glycosyltransferase involved in cell wall biosynthesis
MSAFSRLLITPIIHGLRIWDAASSARVDHFIANSANVARRVERYYRRQADVIHPPVDTDFYTPDESLEAGDFFLIVSALVPYKRIDLAVEAFNRTGVPLKIVGTGPEYKALKKRSRPNIEFPGSVDPEVLRSLYRGAKAFILPGEEDFGIATLEAQACGTPVIAYGRGGSRETVVPGSTGLLFEEPSVAGLLGALDKFRTFECNRAVIRTNAMGFSRKNFKERISGYIRQKWIEHGGRA